MQTRWVYYRWGNGVSGLMTKPKIALKNYIFLQVNHIKTFYKRLI